ncbi:MAG: hypothetical protein H6622_05825 [Halobacteriovoraceae bacterium]|nr:hypothetical protein [Halobacteriovoraceae bacterium]
MRTVWLVLFLSLFTGCLKNDGTLQDVEKCSEGYKEDPALGVCVALVQNSSNHFPFISTALPTDSIIRRDVTDANSIIYQISVLDQSDVGFRVVWKLDNIIQGAPTNNVYFPYVTTPSVVGIGNHKIQVLLYDLEGVNLFYTYEWTLIVDYPRNYDPVSTVSPLTSQQILVIDEKVPTANNCGLNNNENCWSHRPAVQISNRNGIDGISGVEVIYSQGGSVIGRKNFLEVSGSAPYSISLTDIYAGYNINISDSITTSTTSKIKAELIDVYSGLKLKEYEWDIIVRAKNTAPIISRVGSATIEMIEGTPSPIAVHFFDNDTPSQNLVSNGQTTNYASFELLVDRNSDGIYTSADQSTDPEYIFNGCTVNLSDQMSCSLTILSYSVGGGPQDLSTPKKYRLVAVMRDDPVNGSGGSGLPSNQLYWDINLSESQLAPSIGSFSSANLTSPVTVTQIKKAGVVIDPSVLGTGNCTSNSTYVREGDVLTFEIAVNEPDRDAYNIDISWDNGDGIGFARNDADRFKATYNQAGNKDLTTITVVPVEILEKMVMGTPGSDEGNGFVDFRKDITFRISVTDSPTTQTPLNSTMDIVIKGVCDKNVPPVQNNSGADKPSFANRQIVPVGFPIEIYPGEFTDNSVELADRIIKYNWFYSYYDNLKCHNSSGESGYVWSSVYALFTMKDLTFIPHKTLLVKNDPAYKAKMCFRLVVGDSGVGNKNPASWDPLASSTHSDSTLSKYVYYFTGGDDITEGGSQNANVSNSSYYVEVMPNEYVVNDSNLSLGFTSISDAENDINQRGMGQVATWFDKNSNTVFTAYVYRVDGTNEYAIKLFKTQFGEKAHVKPQKIGNYFLAKNDNQSEPISDLSMTGNSNVILLSYIYKDKEFIVGSEINRLMVRAIDINSGQTEITVSNGIANRAGDIAILSPGIWSVPYINSDASNNIKLMKGSAAVTSNGRENNGEIAPLTGTCGTIEASTIASTADLSDHYVVTNDVNGTSVNIYKIDDTGACLQNNNDILTSSSVHRKIDIAVGTGDNAKVFVLAEKVSTPTNKISLVVFEDPSNIEANIRSHDPLPEGSINPILEFNNPGTMRINAGTIEGEALITLTNGNNLYMIKVPEDPSELDRIKHLTPFLNNIKDNAYTGGGTSPARPFKTFDLTLIQKDFKQGCRKCGEAIPTQSPIERDVIFLSYLHKDSQIEVLVQMINTENETSYLPNEVDGLGNMSQKWRTPYFYKAP